MRTLALTSSAIAVVLGLFWSMPRPASTWQDADPASISTSDLTSAAGDIPVAPDVDAH
jgi:hypothetical protein